MYYSMAIPPSDILRWGVIQNAVPGCSSSAIIPQDMYPAHWKFIHFVHLIFGDVHEAANGAVMAWGHAPNVYTLQNEDHTFRRREREEGGFPWITEDAKTDRCNFPEIRGLRHIPDLCEGV